MWYVVQVSSGSEERMAELIGSVAGGSPALSECFMPRYQTEVKIRGNWITCEKPLFQGYLIAVTEDPKALAVALAGINDFCRVLKMGDDYAPLSAEEVQIIGAFTEPGRRVVPMSRAVKEGEKVVIVEGPLVGHEALLKEIDRRRSTAILEFNICGRRVTTRVGLAVVSAQASEE